MNFSEFQTWFDEHFPRVLEQKVDTFCSLSESTDVSAVVSYIRAIAQDGKRFRPFLTYTASGLNREDCENHLLLFAGIELLHIFALIHDDIMDDADTRHGVTCAHRKFREQYGASTAEAIAILLGDIVFAWAYECIYEYTHTFPQFKDRIIEEFTRLVREVTHGQLLDVLSSVQSSLDEKAIVEKMTLKTARYSFVQPLRLGFVVKGDNPADQLFTEAFGVPLGIGYQIQDDLLDSAPTIQTGKTQFLDISSRQQTLLSWYMQYRATSEEQGEFLTFFGKQNIPEHTHGQLERLLESSGALAYCKAQSDQYFITAGDAIRAHRTSDSAQWENILMLVQKRNK